MGPRGPITALRLRPGDFIGTTLWSDAPSEAIVGQHKAKPGGTLWTSLLASLSMLRRVATARAQFGLGLAKRAHAQLELYLAGDTKKGDKHVEKGRRELREWQQM